MVSPLRQTDLSGMNAEPSESEIKPKADGSPSQASRSKRRGSVLRREALGRLRQGNTGSALYEGGRGLPDITGGAAPSGETLNSVMRRCSLSVFHISAAETKFATKSAHSRPPSPQKRRVPRTKKNTFTTNEKMAVGQQTRNSSNSDFRNPMLHIRRLELVVSRPAHRSMGDRRAPC